MKQLRLCLLVGVAIAIALSPEMIAASEIHDAARDGDVDKVRQLLIAGAEMDAKDERGFTPLLWAVYGGQLNVTELLIDQGADVRYEHPAFGAAADLSFHMECQRGYSGVTEYLASKGVEFDPNSVGPRKLNRLRVAVMLGSTDMVRWLIDRGADVNAASPQDGRVALLWAAQKGNLEIVTALIVARADVDAVDSSGIAPVQWAVENGHADVVESLIDAGARLDLRETTSGQGLMHRVSIYGHVDIAKLLLSRGTEVDAKDAAQKTPIYYACKYGNEQLAGLLVDKGADIDDCGEKNFGSSTFLTRPLADDEAIVWRLASRGWAVRTSTSMLVFDAEEFVVTRPTEPCLANGFVTPEELVGHDVFAMYTCYHGEVGEPAYIHEIEDDLERVTYIHNAGDPWRGCKNSMYLEPRETRDLGGVRLHTIWPISYMPSLAYLCEVGGLVVYYADVTSDDLEKYKEDLNYLSSVTDRVDIAFLPAAEFDPSRESDLALFVERFSPRTIILLHTDGNDEVHEAVAEWTNDRGLEIPVLRAEYPGDRFEFRLQNISKTGEDSRGQEGTQGDK
jgi:ankyrin repeat protein